jgi:hypothetical protein
MIEIFLVCLEKNLGITQETLVVQSTMPIDPTTKIVLIVAQKIWLLPRCFQIMLEKFDHQLQ